MIESKPRDLTPGELALVRAPAACGAESAPLRIPPGTQIPVELWSPATEITAAAAPSAGPHEAGAAESSGSRGAAPSGAPPPSR